jgi:hypothetical protein
VSDSDKKGPLLVLPSPPRPKVGQLELAECVAIENEIRLLSIRLKEKRSHLRRCLKDRMEVEDGPLKSFAARIARGRFP